MATARKATKATSKAGSKTAGETKAAAAGGKKQTGRVVEDLGNGLAAVYPTDQADYKKLAVELLQAADQPGDVQTRSMPRRFVAPADLVKKAQGA